MSLSLQENLTDLNARFAGRAPEEILRWAVERFGRRVSLACSLGAEDVALVDMLAKIDKTARVFVLDTGRLHEETYETLQMCRTKYGLAIETYFPESAQVEQLLRARGPFSFFDSVENRKECCHIRKVLPLRRALAGQEAWITGMRRAQSVTRGDIGFVELDASNGGIIKINPLAEWSEEQVHAYNRANGVPVNPLHARGFPSIGCAPCTRAVEPGEDVRAGRWWWESPDNKECGLHGNPKRPGA